jgi:hypothetical protein
MAKSAGDIASELDTLLIGSFFMPIRNAVPWQSMDPVRFIDVSPPFPPPKSFVRKRRPNAAIVF